MKTDQPIRVNDARTGGAPGAPVRIVQVEDEAAQAMAVVEELKRLRRADRDWDASECAVLARTHGELLIIRRHCAEDGFPVRWTIDREKAPPLMRVREIDAFLRELKAMRTGSCTAAELATRLRGDGEWRTLLRRFLDAWRDEVGEGEVAVQDTLEFFYEALAEERLEAGLGTGVRLSTVHGAKGTEFRHVLIPGGGWRSAQDDRQMEEERRVFYVAMTRAKNTLVCFQRADAPHPHLELIENGDIDVQTFEAAPEQRASMAPASYAMLGMKDVYLDYAGSKPPSHAIHRHLAALQENTPLSAAAHGDRVLLKDPDGHTVAHLSARATREWRNRLNQIESIRVVAMVRRTREDSQEEYRDRCQSDHWEVPLAELEYATE